MVTYKALATSAKIERINATTKICVQNFEVNKYSDIRSDDPV
jgi:hypothetical protein